MIASDALQAAIYTALNGNVSAGVYDHVPTGAAAPYIVLGETTDIPWDTHDSDGSEETITLHLWDQALGSMRLKALMEAVDALLHDASFALSGATLVMLRREFTAVMRDTSVPNEVWRHGVMRYRAFISE